MGFFRRKHRESETPLEASRDAAHSGEPHGTDVPEADPYSALRDIDVFGQGSADGMNRTDDPSRGPIE